MWTFPYSSAAQDFIVRLSDSFEPTKVSLISVPVPAEQASEMLWLEGDLLRLPPITGTPQTSVQSVHGTRMPSLGDKGD